MTLQRLSELVTRAGIMLEAHSTSEGVRGRLHRDQRPDFCLIDDFETNKTKGGKAYVDQAQEHIDELATGIAAERAILYLGNFITELGAIKRLMDRAREDTRLIVHDGPSLKMGKRRRWESDLARQARPD